MKSVKGEGDITSLSKVINLNVNFPDYVFNKKFRSHLFFDADLRSTESLQVSIQGLATSTMNSGSVFSVFSALNQAFLGRLTLEDNWNDQIEKIDQDLKSSGNFGGVFFVEHLLRLVVYQRRPIDIGVIALQAHLEILPDDSPLRDDLVHVTEMASLKNMEVQTTSSAPYSNYDFMKTLIHNYN